MFDRKMIHDGVTNNFTFVCLGQRVMLKPLSPREIARVKLKRERKKEKGKETVGEKGKSLNRKEQKRVRTKCLKNSSCLPKRCTSRVATLERYRAPHGLDTWSMKQVMEGFELDIHGKKTFENKVSIDLPFKSPYVQMLHDRAQLHMGKEGDLV
ncbi:hypothetical protein CR513_14329, partial [Mucuna pruriens]